MKTQQWLSWTRYAVLIPLLPLMAAAQTQRVASVMLSPPGGTYTGSVTVALACATPGATILYAVGTTSGNTSNYAAYTAPLLLTTTTVVMAKATKSGSQDSALAYAAYTVIIPKVATPTFSPAGGTFTGSVTVALSCATPGTTILYAMGVNSPGASNFLAYTGPVTLTNSAMVTAKATRSGYLDSGTASASYTVIIPKVATPIFAPAGGTYTGSVTVAISCATPGATILYALGTSSINATNFSVFTSPLLLTTTTVIMAKATAIGYQGSASAETYYTIIIPRVATPTISPSYGTYTGSVTVTISCATPGATILYATGATSSGAASFATYTGPFALTTSAVVTAKAVESGYLDSATVSTSYTVIIPKVAAPTLMPPGGTYTGAVTVALACATPGATLLYALGTSSANATNFIVYTTPLVLPATTVIMVKATASGYQDSAVVYTSYTIILPKVATPTITPSSGTYTSSVTVAISCATPGVTLLYALGANSSAASNFVTYTGPFAITASAVVTTKAVESGYQDSATASASYTVIVPRAAAPTFAPNGGTFTGSVSVALSCATPGATILYALGTSSANATNFTAYAAPLLLTTTTVVMAKATESGYQDSTTAYASYAILLPKVAAPTFAPVGGTYTGSVTVTISCATPGAAILYAIGANSAGASIFTPYVGPITLTTSSVVTAKAVAGGSLDSVTVSAMYSVTVPRVSTPTFTPAGGIYTSSVTVAISCATPGAAILYALGTSSANATNFAPYTVPVTLGATSVIMAKATKTGYQDSGVAGAAYTVIVPKVATPTFAPPGGIYTGSVTVALSCATPAVTILYALGSSSVNASNFVAYTAPIALPASSVIMAKATKSGYQDSGVAGAAYTIIVPKVAPPTFAPPGGIYTGSVTVAISCATPDATILITRGTTSGNATNFTTYTGPMTVTTTTVLMAKTTKTGFVDSASVGAYYTVVPLPRVATPTFQPAGGSYKSGMSVTILCATPGASIFYTLDGSEPTSNALPYEGTFTLDAPTVIHARAVKTGMQDSAAAGTSYY